MVSLKVWRSTLSDTLTLLAGRPPRTFRSLPVLSRRVSAARNQDLWLSSGRTVLGWFTRRSLEEAQPTPFPPSPSIPQALRLLLAGRVPSTSQPRRALR